MFGKHVCVYVYVYVATIKVRRGGADGARRRAPDTEDRPEAARAERRGPRWASRDRWGNRAGGPLPMPATTRPQPTRPAPKPKPPAPVHTPTVPRTPAAEYQVGDAVEYRVSYGKWAATKVTGLWNGNVQTALTGRRWIPLKKIRARGSLLHTSSCARAGSQTTTDILAAQGGVAQP